MAQRGRRVVRVKTKKKARRNTPRFVEREAV
jgi:hypothetical protein